MSGKVRAGWRRFFLEATKLNLEVLWVMAVFVFLALSYLYIIAPTSSLSEMQLTLAFMLDVLLPVPVILTGAFLVSKEAISGTIDFVETRVGLEKFWRYRVIWLVVVSGMAVFLSVNVPQLFYGPILPPAMKLTVFVPALFLLSCVSLVSSLVRDPFVASGFGLVLWLYLYVGYETLLTKLLINEVAYYPFLEWAILKDRGYLISSLTPNRVVFTAISLALFLITYLLYAKRVHF